METATATTLKDYKKVGVDLKTQLESFNTENLSKADTQEKIVLPTAEGNFIFYNLIIIRLLILKDVQGICASLKSTRQK